MVQMIVCAVVVGWLPRHFFLLFFFFAIVEISSSVLRRFHLLAICPGGLRIIQTLSSARVVSITPSRHVATSKLAFQSTPRSTAP